MAGSFGGIEIGKRSLMTHSLQIQTAGHNISNADTEGYTRQRVNVRAFDPLYRPDLERAETAGQIGQGTQAESVKRLRDELLDTRIVAQTNIEAYWETREKYYTMLEQIYNEPEEISVRGNMDKFWESWQELSIYPDQDAARQAVVSRADSLTNSIRQRNLSLTAIGNQINEDINGTVRQVNDYARQIAELNHEIVRSQALGDDPNDLMDRRDLLFEKLGKLSAVHIAFLCCNIDIGDCNLCTCAVIAVLIDILLVVKLAVYNDHTALMTVFLQKFSLLSPHLTAEKVGHFLAVLVPV